MASLSPRGRSLEIHRVLQDYRNYQKQKSIIKNRINNMQINKLRNFSKIRGIESKKDKLSQIYRINRTQNRKAKQNIEQHSYDQLLRKKESTLKIKQQKKNIIMAKMKILNFKGTMTQRVKSESRINNITVLQNKEVQRMKKKEKAKQIKQDEQLQKSKIKTKLKHKLKKVEMESFERLGNFIEIEKKSKAELDILKSLQKSLLEEYSESVVSLRNSRMKANHKLRY